MSNDWQHRPDIIEGAFEVIEERDAGETYSYPSGGYIEMDPNPPYVTYAILGINIAVWLLMNLVGFVLGWGLNTQLLRFGAKVNALIVQGQYWRLFTAMFLHIGIMHLFFNSYALYIYGPIVEKLYGKAKFTTVYIISGLTGSMLSYMFSLNPAAGASGAIFGLMGSLLYFRKREKLLFHRVFGPGLFIIIGINLLYGFIQPGIDNWGHIGGLVGGFLTGNAIGLYRERKVTSRQLLIWVLIIAIFVTGFWYGQRKYGKEVYLSKAYDALRRGDIKEAESYAGKAAEGSIRDRRVKEMLKAIYIKKVEQSLISNKVSEALSAINELLDYYPGDIDSLFIRAQIYEGKGDYEKALSDYIKVAEIKSNSAEVWFRAGRTAYNAGKLADARKYLKKALELDPGLHQARSLLDELNKMI